MTMKEAKEVVLDFLRKVQPEADHGRISVFGSLGEGERDENVNVGPIWKFESPLGQFEVAKLGAYVSHFYAGGARPVTGPKLAEQEAIRIASEFAEKVYPGFEPRRFKAKVKAYAKEELEVELEQVPVDDEVSIFPNDISVIMQADSGRIRIYYASALGFRRTTPLRISREQALDIYHDQLGPGGQERATIKSPEIMEHPINKATRARTLWVVTYRRRGPQVSGRPRIVSGHQIYIDADTGAVIPAKTLDDQW
jgi:hypothetical protein